MESLQILAAPLLMSLILSGMHCYLGLHVITRGVIFVDLSLAQIAALGSIIALLFGFEDHSLANYLIPLICTWIASVFFALSRSVEDKFNQEAIIGIVYAFASAMVLLLADRMSHGTEHIKEILVGSILFVDYRDVFHTFIIYSLVGIIHYIFRNQFIANSNGTHQSVFWDFMFYALFGVIITSSVGSAGVLQVFAYLVVPALVSSVFAKSLKNRLMIGWGLSFILCVLSLYLSFVLDFPTGPFIIAMFTACPIALLIYNIIKKMCYK